ncbi:hypothetical protein J0H58_04100, partial [bacterium]|nr:hypothetical protein [bacterium]
MTSAASGPTTPAAYAPCSPEHAELRAVIDEELARLPEPLRAAVVLCDLGGKTRAEAAADLGCPEGTVAARLHRARKALAERLARRGVTAPAALAVASAVVPADLFASVTGFAAGGPVPAAVRALADGVVRGLTAHPLSLALTAIVATVLAAGAGVLWAAGVPASEGTTPVPDAPPAEVKVGPVYAVGYSPDGSGFVHVGGGKATVRDAATRAERFSTDAEFAHFNGDGTKLFAFTADDRFLTLDGATGKGRRSDVRGRAAAAHGMRWAVASADGLTRIESAGVSHDYTNMPIPGPVPFLDGQRRGDPAGLPAGHRGRGGAFSPDGTRYAGIHAADPGRKRFGPVGVWKTDAGGTRVATLSFVPDWPALALAWAPDGKQIAVGYSDGVRVYDADTSDRLKHLPGGPTTAVAWSPDGATLAVGDGRPDAADEKTVRVCVRLLDVRSGDERRRIDGFPDNLPVVALAFRPDGKELACGAGLPPGVEHPPGRPAVPNAVGLRLVALDLPVRRGRNHVSDLSFAPDGKTYLVVAGGKATVKDFATDRIVWEADAEAARFTADGTAVVTMAGAGETAVTRRATATGTAVKTHPWPKLDAAWNHVAFNQNGYLYAAHFDYEARLFAAGGEEPVKLEGRHAPLDRVILRPTGKAVTFSPDGRLVAAVGVMLTPTEIGAAVWDVRTGQRLHGYPNPARSGRWVPATAVAFSADSKQLAVAVGKVVQLFDTDRFAATVRLPDTPGSGPVTALAFGPDGKQLAVGYRLPLPNGADREPKVVGHKTEVQLIDLVTNKELKRFDGFEGVDHMGPTVLPVTALAFSPDGQTLLAGTGRSAVEDLPADAVARGEVKRFALVVQPPAAKPPVPEWRELVRLPDFDDRVQSVAFAPDGKTLAVGGRGGAAQHTLTMWDAATQKKLWAGGPVPAGTTGVAFSPDGRLVAATRDKTTGLYETATGRSVLMNPPLPGGKVVAFSPDGKHLAVGDGKRTVVFPAVGGPAVLDTQAQPEPPAGPTPAVVAWSPNGTRLVTSWHDPFGDALFGSDIATLQTRQLKALIGHPARVTAAAWSPDGKVVATGCGKGDVIVWDAETRKELKRTRIGGRGGEGLVRALAFAPDGRTLAAAVSFDEGKNAERVVLLDTVTGNRNQDLQGFGNFTPVALAFAPDGRTLAVGLADFLPQVQPPPGAAPRPLGSVALFTTDPEPRAAAP